MFFNGEQINQNLRWTGLLEWDENLLQFEFIEYGKVEVWIWMWIWIWQLKAWVCRNKRGKKSWRLGFQAFSTILLWSVSIETLKLIWMTWKAFEKFRVWIAELFFATITRCEESVLNCHRILINGVLSKQMMSVYSITILVYGPPFNMYY